MGLTIHYQLQTASRSIAKARAVIQRLHQVASTLPFEQVGPVQEFIGDACDYNTCTDDQAHRWLLIQANGNVKVGKGWYSVTPQRIIAFNTRPGRGCEPANFGLCLYPSTIEVEGRNVRTGITGWRWTSFCKTQYASQHGVEHFLRCHLLVVRMLDYCKELALETTVDDEGGYFEKRDMESLAKEVGDWNEMIAGFAGQMKDLVGPELEAAILHFPNFEHLEARGMAG